MQIIPINEFVAEQGQAKAAELLGVTQGAISKALRAGRKINVYRYEDGSYSAEEVRAFPAQKVRMAS
ncbi:Cro/CI family transcriptional regulator [Pseudomonas aeruginosa]|uniref:Cro/CI family transcriptional regulator n=1 Tax=Pseudomonas TaxID=286 RepID=UPI000F7F49AB|nr:Cro/CI family transcriptional regulator [Pseudomonas aeruginosa]MBA4993256.1 hypothetical protein [Pseudomonas aeruginosa]RTB42117.1 hypothetical protein EJ655_11765 [Pseudomonas aeruginosa]